MWPQVQPWWFSVYSFLNTKCGKKMGADPLLPKAQMKTNKFELCLHLLQNEMYHPFFFFFFKELNFEETNCADCVNIESSSLSHCPKGR